MTQSTHAQSDLLEGILAALPAPLFDELRANVHPSGIAGAEAVEIADLLGIDFALAPFTVEDLKLGLEVERELCEECAPSLVDILDEDLVNLGKIVVANLHERSDYYTQLTRAQAPGDPPLPLHEHPGVGAD